jgi:hypothetical protein
LAHVLSSVLGTGKGISLQEKEKTTKVKKTINNPIFDAKTPSEPGLPHIKSS